MSVSIIVPYNAFIAIPLGFLVITGIVAIVRWVLDILP